MDKNNRIDAIIGTSWQLDKSDMFQASGQGYPDDFILNNLGSASVTLPNQSATTQSSLLSFYARANYAYQDKYLLTITGRSDASSNFHQTNGWAISHQQGLPGVSRRKLYEKSKLGR